MKSTYTHLVVVLLSSLLLTACGAARSFDPVDVSFKSVKKDNGVAKPVNQTSYEDRDVAIAAAYLGAVRGGHVQVEIKNKSNQMARILWDEAAFIDPMNKLHRTIHGGVRLIARNESQPPSLIPPGGTHEDLIQSADNVHWLEYGEYSSWMNLGLLGHMEAPNRLTSNYSRRPAQYKSATKEEYEKARAKVETHYQDQLFGKSFKIILPMEVGGAKRTYELSFFVNGFMANTNSKSRS